MNGTPSVDSPNDEVLMLAVENGDARKLAVLFDRHHRVLFHFYLRLTGDRDASEDLVQDVFFRMLKYRQTYRPGMDFATWMYRIARNARTDYFRKRSREVALEEGWDAAGDADAAPGRGLEARQEAAMLRRALAKLPEEKREVLVLSRFQNLRYEQIGELLGCDVGAVKVRVYRALRELREIYSQISGRKAS
ncbi:MAG: RNA polymerase sigma factor [Acidobacteria bacterium]|nr:RNA polymerase sigma factor [Acidobacteriota bacterium]